MSNPTLFKLTKPTGGLRHTWFQIITRFLLCFAEDDSPCLDGLWLNMVNKWINLILKTPSLVTSCDCAKVYTWLEREIDLAVNQDVSIALVEYKSILQLKPCLDGILPSSVSNLRGDYHNPLPAKLVHTQKINLRRLVICWKTRSYLLGNYRVNSVVC